MRLIVLAAGQGTRLRPLTDDRPKALVELAGRPLLEYQLDAARAAGIDDVVVVGGHLADQLRRPGIRLVVNPDYETTNMVTSLFAAEEWLDGDVLVSYGDIAYAHHVLEAMVAETAPVAVAVDREWRPYWERRFEDPLSDAESLRIDEEGNLTSIGQQEDVVERIEAQYIGLIGLRGDGLNAVRRAYDAALEDERGGRPPLGAPRAVAGLYMTDLLQGMIALGEKLRAVPIEGGWVEIDGHDDLRLAEELVAAGRLAGTRTTPGAG